MAGQAGGRRVRSAGRFINSSIVQLSKCRDARGRAWRAGGRRRGLLLPPALALLSFLPLAVAPAAPPPAPAPKGGASSAEAQGAKAEASPSGLDPLAEESRKRAAATGVPDPLADLRVPGAWALGASGRGIVVAVVDTGVDVAHEDLAGQCLPGYNAIDGTGDVTPSFWHGTAVAGAIAALRENGKGYRGVAPEAKILPVKVGRARVAGGRAAADVDDPSDKAAEAYRGPGVDHETLARGIRWAADRGARVLCVALGSFVGSDGLRSAVEYAQSKGCLIVAPSGAWQGANQDLYPAAYPGVLAVTAWQWKRSRSGDGEDAPEENLPAISAMANVSPRTDVAAPVLAPAARPGGYGEVNGTSCAAALTAGVAALAWSASPGMNADEVRRLLKSSGRCAVGTRGFYEFFDVRIVDAEHAVKMARGAADPGVRRIVCIPASPLPGQEMTATVTVENAGRGGAEGIGVSMMADGASLPAIPASFGPGERKDVMFRLRAPRGKGGFRVRAVCSAAAAEEDVVDNTLEQEVAFAERAEPVGYARTLRNSDFRMESPDVEFIADIVNVGSAPGDLVVQGEVNDKAIGREELKAMAIGEHRTVSFRWSHPGRGEKAFAFDCVVFVRGRETIEEACDITTCAFIFPLAKTRAETQ